MVNLLHKDFEIVISELDNEVTINWKGLCDFKDSNKILSDYFNALLKDIGETEIKEITMKFNDLEIFNSSAISPLTEFIAIIDSKGIKISIAYNEKIFWQAMSFKPLKMVFKSSKNVKILSE